MILMHIDCSCASLAPSRLSIACNRYAPKSVSPPRSYRKRFTLEYSSSLRLKKTPYCLFEINVELRFPYESNELFQGDSLSQTDLNDSGEISEYPERLPAPRPLSKEEVENDDS
ncbi:hypothetical protein Y032_0399g744 [Ancylostoma ceylanicum]|nr:hypothetical protein Y032_0399g744 [Ancylostoma ceylanicum]